MARLPRPPALREPPPEPWPRLRMALLSFLEFLTVLYLLGRSLFSGIFIAAISYVILESVIAYATYTGLRIFTPGNWLILLAFSIFLSGLRVVLIFRGFTSIDRHTVLSRLLSRITTLSKLLLYIFTVLVSIFLLPFGFQNILSISEFQIYDINSTSVFLTCTLFGLQLFVAVFKFAEMTASFNRKRIVETAVDGQNSKADLHRLIWCLTIGANLQNVKAVRYMPINIFITDIMSFSKREALVDKCVALSETLGFSLSYRMPAELGSWWQRLWVVSKMVLTHQEVQDRLRTVEEAFKTVYLDKPQAEANKIQATAVSEVLDSVKEFEEACVQVGNLLVVKLTKNDGRPSVEVRTLSPSALRRLEENQFILRTPKEVLPFLEEESSSKETRMLPSPRLS